MSAAWQPAESWSPQPAAALDLWRVELELRPGDWELLDEDERRRASRLLMAEKGRQLARARAALRRILARYLDADPGRLVFAYEGHGKPYLKDEARLCFNLSHSHRLALVAVLAGDRVGVDVERCDPARPLDRIAERFFSGPEVAYYRALPAADRPGAFYRGWTRKEAYVKAWGTGLSFSSRRFTVAFDAERPRLLSTEMSGDDPDRWHWADLSPGPGYAGAVCWEGAVRRLRCWQQP